MMNAESKRQVTVEDLLRLKRAERPPVEFWADFDRELREKQLAALVEKQPWWRRMPRPLHGMARFRLPIGATAVFIVTLLSIRDYQPVLPRPAAGLSGADVGRSEEPATVELPAVSVEPPPASDPAAHVAVTPSAAPSVAGLGDSPAGELARMVPTISAEGGSVASTELRPSARSIAENRAVAEALLGTPTGFEARALPARTAPQEPLAQMSNPSETRRSRFALAFAAAAIGTSPAPTARVARRLSDEQLYDSIHRFGASGNSVSFRF